MPTPLCALLSRAFDFTLKHIPSKRLARRYKSSTLFGRYSKIICVVEVHLRIFILSPTIYTHTITSCHHIAKYYSRLYIIFETEKQSEYTYTALKFSLRLSAYKNNTRADPEQRETVQLYFTRAERRFMNS